MINGLHKEWVEYPSIPDNIDSELEDYPQIFRQILFNRGICDRETAGNFLQAREPLFPPEALMGIQPALELIRRMILEKRHIVVFGDYDVDGVTATTLLVQMLRLYEANVDMYIPNRYDEGYGFSGEALRGVLEHHPDLIITVDCGVRSIDEVAAAAELGVATIVTDHHQPLEILPSAAALICPRQPGDPYPNKELAGVGIAYKLAQAMLERYPLTDQCAEQWLDLVALGTIADLAKLEGENRVLVRHGLELMRQAARPGIQALAEVSRVNLSKLNASHIGFMLAPRLNAAGRMDSAKIAYDLLMADSVVEARPLASELDGQNKERQQTTKNIQEKVAEEPSLLDNDWLILCAQEGFSEGVLGLAASKMAETYYRPAIIGNIKGDFVRASCRSIPEIHITTVLDECRDLLLKHGGHAMAAGLTVHVDNVEELRSRLTAIIQREAEGKTFMPRLVGEMVVSLQALAATALFPWLDELEPTGADNPVPLFMAKGVVIERISTVGKEREHLKLVLKDTEKRGDALIDAIAFRFGYLFGKTNEDTDTEGMLEKDPSKVSAQGSCLPLKRGDRIDIAFSYEINHFNGNETIQVNIRDIRPHPEG